MRKRQPGSSGARQAERARGLASSHTKQRITFLSHTSALASLQTAVCASFGARLSSPFAQRKIVTSDVQVASLKSTLLWSYGLSGGSARFVVAAA